MSRTAIVLAFVVCTVLGTLSHEFGHIVVAKCLGYETTLHYASMNWTTGLDYPAVNARHVLLVSLGGPAQTLLFGLLGFGLLCYRRKHPTFVATDWVLIFLTLFLSRMIANPVFEITAYISGRSETPFGGDEERIALLLGWHPSTITLPLFLLAVACCAVSIFWFIPVQYRKRFLVWGILGAGAGYFLWMIVLGPMVLP